jgi:hypothetical protein
MESTEHNSLKVEVREIIPTSASLKKTILDITAFALEQLSPEIAHLSIYFASDTSSLGRDFFQNRKIAPMFSELAESNPPPWSSYVTPNEKRLDLVVDSSRIGFNKEICLLEDIVRGLAHEISEYRVITEEEFASRWKIFPPPIMASRQRFQGWLAIQCIVRDRLADMLSAQNGFEREQFTGTMWTQWAQSVAKAFLSKDQQDQPASGLFILTLLIDRSVSLQLAGLDDLSKKYTNYMEQALLSLEPKRRLASYWEDYLLMRNAIQRTKLRIIDLFELLQSYQLTVDAL